jgi:peptidoglycan-N-acetylglucosamine deacetylase
MHLENKIFETLFPRLTWQINDREKTIFLSFDDGPIPEITPWVLETLNKYHAKATFFCVGENTLRNKGILLETSSQSHSIGNHTFSHINGLRHSKQDYLENVRKGKEAIENILSKKIDLFRPPYGLLLPSQKNAILEDSKIVMWSILSQDYDQKISLETCLNNSVKDTQNGDIVLFHDSIKAAKNLKHVLPIFLDVFTQKGFVFEAL